jgi:hypothetical protein
VLLHEVTEKCADPGPDRSREEERTSPPPRTAPDGVSVALLEHVDFPFCVATHDDGCFDLEVITLGVLQRLEVSLSCGGI